MTFHIPPDLLLVLVRPESTFDERKAAAIELAVAAYKRGRDEPTEDIEELLTIAGITIPAAVRLS